MSNLELLQNKQIEKILISPEYLKLTTDQGSYAWEAVGGCCSSSYIQDFVGVENLFKGKIISVEEVEDIKPAESVDYNEIQYYGVRFNIASEEFGELTAVLSYRNESNGYYGGDLDPTTPDLIDDDKMMEITTDWNEDMYLLNQN